MEQDIWFYERIKDDPLLTLKNSVSTCGLNKLSFCMVDERICRPKILGGAC